jgi:hypothetical protein
LWLWRAAIRGKSLRAGLPSSPWTALATTKSESSSIRTWRIMSVLANFARTSSDEASSRW